MNFVLQTRNCAFKTRNFLFKMMNFAATRCSSPYMHQKDRWSSTTTRFGILGSTELQVCIDNDELCIKMMNYALKMMNYALQMMNRSLKMMNYLYLK